MSIADQIIQKYKGQNQGSVADRVIQRYKSQGKQGSVADRVIAKFRPQEPQKPKGAWNAITRNLVKPVASASNLLEDVGKTAGFGIGKAFGAKGSFQDWAKKGDINFLQHQKDVWSGKNNRTYSDIAREIADTRGNKFQRGMIKTAGYGGDFLADPLNKVKIASLTAKGLLASKTGKTALSVADQVGKGERALLQFGNTNILPKFVDKAVLGGSTKLNDALRANRYTEKLMTAGSKISSKIRPAGVSREEFKILSDAKNQARNTVGYKTDQSIEFAKGLAKTLKNRKATDIERKALLHAVEKGSRELAPKGYDDVFEAGAKFKATNEEAWQKLGGAVLEGHGLSHVATKEVAELMRKKALGGGKIYSSITPQDAHRQWVKVDGKVMNMADEGISYVDDAFEKGKGAYLNKAGNPVKVTQATAKEINETLIGQSKNEIFQEDLPLVVAKMGISTGRKQAGVEFLEATKGLKGETAKKLVNETYEKMTNIESLNKAIKGFDAIQNVWKSQALIAPSYHIRNIAGNLWNNYLADVKTGAYAQAGKLQNSMRTGKLTTAQKVIVEDLKKNGVIGTGQFGADITQTINQEIGKASINPFSQKNFLYRANFATGSALEDNAKIAHFISKRAEGYGVKQAAESVKKYLFDYGDLTFTEKNFFKRVMPFYTWTSKNLPLQVQQFFQNPGKFSKVGIAKQNIEKNVEQPDEKYLSDYIKSNTPIRYRTDKDGNTKYFLLGSWLPASSALKILMEPHEEVIGQTTPIAKLPIETIFNQGTFFKDTLGNFEKIKKYPSEKQSYLGLDLDPRTVNALRSIRLSNELHKLNPGEIFGAKNEPSMFQGIFDNASNQRGGRHTPESTQADRFLEMLVGKSQNYDPQFQKTFYDRDTADRIGEYKSSIARARKNNQTKLVEKLLEEMNRFKFERKNPDQVYEEVMQRNDEPFY